MRRLLLLNLLCVALLSGCSLSPVAIPTVHQYFLQPKVKMVKASTGKHATSLMVMPIASAPGYDSHNMLYVITPFNLQSFASHQWVSSPAAMWQGILVDALNHQRRLKAVVAAPSGVQTAYSLQVRLTHFEQNFQRPQSRFMMSAHAQLIRNSTSRVVASRDFNVVIPAQTNTPYAGVLAANQALAKIDSSISRFVVAYLR